MSKLSLIPKGVVTAMQVALVVLVLLAVVPVATGGLNVVGGSTNASYDAAEYRVHFALDANISTDLYFDVNVGYAVNILAGGYSAPLYDGERPVKKNGGCSISESTDVPLVNFIMMMVCSASDDSDVTVAGGVRGSTLGGMLTLNADIGRTVADISGGAVSISAGKDSMNASFTASGDILDDIGPVSVAITIGDLHLTVTGTAGAFAVTATSSAGTLTEALEAAVSGGTAEVLYDSASVTITEKEVQQIIDILSILYRRCL